MQEEEALDDAFHLTLNKRGIVLVLVGLSLAFVVYAHLPLLSWPFSFPFSYYRHYYYGPHGSASASASAAVQNTIQYEDKYCQLWVPYEIESLCFLLAFPQRDLSMGTLLYQIFHDNILHKVQLLLYYPLELVKAVYTRQ